MEKYFIYSRSYLLYISKHEMPIPYWKQREIEGTIKEVIDTAKDLTEELGMIPDSLTFTPDTVQDYKDAFGEEPKYILTEKYEYAFVPSHRR